MPDRRRLRQNDVEIAHRGPAQQPELEPLEGAQTACDELRVRDPVLVEQPHPVQSKRLAPLARARADEDDTCAGALRGSQLRGAAGIVEHHHVRAPCLDEFDDGGGMKGGRGRQQRRRERQVGGIRRVAAQARNARSRQANAAAPRARSRASARTPPCRRGPTPARIRVRGKRLLNQRRRTSDRAPAATRLGEIRCSPPLEDAARASRTTASCKQPRMALEPAMHRQAESGLRTVQVPGRQARLHESRAPAVCRGDARIDQQRRVHGQHELHQAMIEQRRPHFERMRHAGSIDLGQQSFGRDPCSRSSQRNCTRAAQVLAPELPIEPQSSRSRPRARILPAGCRPGGPSCRRAPRRRPAARHRRGAASTRRSATAAAANRASVLFNTFERAPIRDQ